LPGLILDVQKGIDECNSKLERLGGSRASKQEQRLYLLKVSQQFSDIIKAALGGIYVGDYFGHATTKQGYRKRLRAVTQNTLSEFAHEMRLRGHKTQVIDVLPESLPDAPTRRQATRADFLGEIAVLIQRTRGRELAGTYKPEIIGSLFQQQSKPWRAIVTRVAAKLFDSSCTAVLLALDHAADDDTSNGIRRIIINPALEVIRKTFEAKTYELLKQHQEGEPITFNHYLTDNIQKARQSHNKKMLAARIEALWGVNPLSTKPLYNVSSMASLNTRTLLEALTTTTEADMETFACSEALDCMEAYYKVDFLPHVSLPSAA
jgi:hypothetical protein